MKHTTFPRAIVSAAAFIACSSAWATNGMLMEGYGPVPLSMGGAAQAYDNGTAAMMNNPATLQLSENGTQFNFAVGMLGPKVTSMGEKSGGTSYWMPALGWVRKNDQFSYGIGIFGQGGMGTEYKAGSMNAAGTAQPVRSELAVGRVIAPVSFKVNDRVNLGATLDFTWASLDMRMAAMFSQMGGMSPMPTGQFASMMGAMAKGQMPAPQTVRIDFSNSNDFTGAAKSTGFAGKLGGTFEASKDLRLGASYQFKSALGDMKTSASGASLTMGQSLPGRMIVRDFQMPAVLAAGAAWTPSSSLLLVADVKRIDWSGVMKDFKMSFESSQGLGTMSFTLPQNWKDQTVVSLGGAYKLNDAWTLRAGYSHSTNPIPDATVHPLFPAIVKDHYTAGLGYQLGGGMSIDAAVSHAPKVTVNAGMLGGAPISHSQTNYQFLFSARY